MRTVTAIALLLLVVGCARTETYQVRLTNKTTGPITFGVVKLGDPFERQWATPEDASFHGEKPSPEMWGRSDSGQTAVSQPITGKFSGNAAAYLRVYEGKLDLVGIMAVSRGSSNRADIMLLPGPNNLTVMEQHDQLTVFHDAVSGPQ